MRKIVLISGGFDPIHSGHIEYIKAAKKLGDILVVAVNSDEWLVRKKGQFFMPLSERTAVLRAIAAVNYVIDFNDSDNTACNAIKMVRQSYPVDRIIFANGGDRLENNIPEIDYSDANIEFVFGVGGIDKKNSSSWILQNWKTPTTLREWGYYRVLYEINNVKVKELVVNPGKSLSMQRHADRTELWFIADGNNAVNQAGPSATKKVYTKFQTLTIDAGEWHKLSNTEQVPLKIIEIQYGFRCDEGDIERND
jgi:cytidyltransferase-like protein